MNGSKSPKVTQNLSLNLNRLIRIQTNPIWGKLYKISIIFIQILIDGLNPNSNFEWLPTQIWVSWDSNSIRCGFSFKLYTVHLNLFSNKPDRTKRKHRCDYGALWVGNIKPSMCLLRKWVVKIYLINKRRWQNEAGGGLVKWAVPLQLIHLWPKQ